MIIERDKYLNQLIKKQDNELIKVITGLRRSGKSYLLFKLFKDYLRANNIREEQIISFAFDNNEDILKLNKYLPNQETIIWDSSRKNYTVNADKFSIYINELTQKNIKYYIFLDEIQLLQRFVFVLNGFLRHENFDVYVTGSNSKMLSKDIITEFRGRGDRVDIRPLSFKEFYQNVDMPFEKAYSEYQYFGGMPYLMHLETTEEKEKYLKGLFTEIYYKDIIDRHNIQNINSFETLFKMLASFTGSYTNPTNIENTFKSKEKTKYHRDTIKKHIEYLKDAFIISETNRYDIKGKKYIGANSKYYFTDVGLRNALINFRQVEPTHIMENIIYNELIMKGYSVDVGLVEISEKNNKGVYVRKQLETDFICNRMNKRVYIQSAYQMSDIHKLNAEQKSLLKINDNFRKIIIVKDNIKRYFTENGIEVIPLEEFLTQDVI